MHQCYSPATMEPVRLLNAGVTRARGQPLVFALQAGTVGCAKALDEQVTEYPKIFRRQPDVYQVESPETFP